MTDEATSGIPLASRWWFAALVPALVGAGACFLSASVFGEYGWSLFLLAPAIVGAVSAYLYNRRFARGFWRTLGVAYVGVMGAGCLIIFAGLDGLMCLVMAAPLAFLLVLPGVALGWVIALQRRERGMAAILLLIASFPLLAGWEAAVERRLPLHEAVTSIVIGAPPEAVWEEVVAFSRIRGEPPLIFRLGLAYPVEAVIEGEGVGAVRRCVFSTGAFVEPITVWDPPRELGFDVIEQPEPMHEISPYPGLHPPHLDHYFVSERGRFLLTRLPDGGTLLEGTTWFRQDIWPNWYWEPMAAEIIHSIHRRVLRHIKREVEAGPG